MAQEIDYTTLKWVRKEIDESLNQTRQALEAYVENPGDSTQIRFCATYLHQVYGTLQMVEIYGGALLAEEMEQLAHAITQEKIKNRDDAYDVLMRAILQLPSYLEHLEQGQPDMPVILLPLLNDLRAARGEHLLSENAFFSPDLQVAPPAPLEADLKSVEIKKYAKKLRPVFQSSLLGLYRDQDIETNLKKIGAVLRELTNTSESDKASRLWWVASGLIESLLHGGHELNNSIKQQIGQLDFYIKGLISTGEQIFDDTPPAELLKNLLYYVATSGSDGKRVSQIKTAFDLDKILPTGNDISEAFDKLRGSNTELMRSVSAVIKEDLLQIKDQLDIFVRSKERNADDLKPFTEQLGRISDTLAMLGLGDLHKIIQDQVTSINGLIASGESPDESGLMEIASSLLYIESSLDGVENAIPRMHENNESDRGTYIPGSEQAQLNHMVITEATQVVSQVKESFNTFANNTAQPEVIENTPALLNQVRGVLSVMARDHAAALLNAAINYISTELLTNRIQPNQAALDALADVITSIEYYLESLAESRFQPDSLLSVAEESMARLGIDINAPVPAPTVVSSDLESTVKAPDEKAVVAAEITIPAPLPVTENVETVADTALTTVTATKTAEPAAVVPIEQPEQDIDEEILEIFLEEADEVFEEMQSNLQAWKDNHDNQDAMIILRRSYHTLKGSGRLAGATILGDFAWAMEYLLNQVIEGKITATPPVFQLLGNAETALTEFLNQLKDQSLAIPDASALIRAAEALAKGETDVVIPEMDIAAPLVTDQNVSDKAITVEPDLIDSFVIETVAESEATELEADTGNDLSAEVPAHDSILSDIFYKETITHLSSIQLYLQEHQQTRDRKVTETLMRALHTLHGSARMADVEHIAVMAEAMHHFFRTLHEADLCVEEEAFSVLTDGAQIIGQLIEQARSDDSIPENYNAIREQIQNLHTAVQTAPAPEPAPSLSDIAALELDTFEFDTLELETEDQQSDEAVVDISAIIAVREHDRIEFAQPETAGDEDDELLNIFLEEAREIQDNNEQTLQHWQDDVCNPEAIAEFLRALHTLKGGARMANIGAIADLSHAVETLMEKISDGRQAPTDTLPQLIQDCHDWTGHSLDLLASHSEIPPATDLLARLARQADGDTATAENISVDDTPGDVGEVITISEAVVEATEATDLQVPDDEGEPTRIIELPDFARMDARFGQSEAEQDAGQDDELTGIFLEEADEIQETTERIIQQWQNEPDNRELIGELQRALHTMKGGARMAGLGQIGDLSHAIESLLEGVIENRFESQPVFTRVVQDSHDWLSRAIENIKQNKPVGAATELIDKLEALARGEDIRMLSQAVEISSDQIQAIEERADAVQQTAELIQLPQRGGATGQSSRLDTRSRTRDEQVRVHADLLDKLVNHASEASIYNSRIGQQLGSWQFNLTELNQTVERLQGQLRKFEIETEAQIMYRHANVVNDVADDDFDPLEMDRFSYMQQLSRGLVESLSDLTSIQDLLETVTDEADVLLLQQSRINSDLQEGLMRTRMTPFSSILPRLRRIVRQTCTEIDKEAQLSVEGAEGEMDRTQLNRVVPALEHILRNAIDHGIETPAEREQAGKEPYGTINLTFSHEGSQVVLRISDNGKGINTEAIRQKAIERGLLKKDARISSSEITEFILQSGFSTATQVTQISGRGVGMDVVNTEIKQLNGSLHIDTDPGKGTVFTIRLPLTVLTNQALMVHIDEKIYAIQLTNIEHVIRVTGDDLVQLISGEKPGYEYAGHTYDQLKIGRVLHGSTPNVAAGKERHPLLLCRSGDHRVAIHVDQLVGRQEIVVKSVGPQLSTVNNISGATILPNGEVALILDLNTLIRSSVALKQLGEEETFIPQEVVVQARPIKVMIVDDSITVRKVTERLLKRHNFETLTAKDGVDALTKLLDVIPDIMLLDVEMPRMDGYELATAMRNDERLRHLPIIMITSRTGEKHRERAERIGVNNYMGKPYQEHELLENIEALIDRK